MSTWVLATYIVYVSVGFNSVPSLFSVHQVHGEPLQSQRACIARAHSTFANFEAMEEARGGTETPLFTQGFKFKCQSGGQESKWTVLMDWKE